MEVLVGTASGLVRVGADRHEASVVLDRMEVRALVADGGGTWAIGDDRSIWRGGADAWDLVTTLDTGLVAHTLLPTSDGVLVGTSSAHLLRLDPGTGTVEAIPGFDQVPTRDKWGNPNGSPADTRSLAQDPRGRLYANVHVGGIVASDDGGESWTQTSLEIWSDVHQVIAPGVGRIHAATGMFGLSSSFDGGHTWSKSMSGLPRAFEEFGVVDACYCRAVAIAGDTLLLTASTGPQTKRAGIFRRPLDSDEPFEQCRTGLPEWFGANINTGCLAATNGSAAFGAAGQVFVSDDEGESWERIADSLPRVLCVSAY